MCSSGPSVDASTNWFTISAGIAQAGSGHSVNDIATSVTGADGLHVSAA